MQQKQKAHDLKKVHDLTGKANDLVLHRWLLHKLVLGTMIMLLDQKHKR
jgi:hypothetical protein